MEKADAIDKAFWQGRRKWLAKRQARRLALVFLAMMAIVVATYAVRHQWDWQAFIAVLIGFCVYALLACAFLVWGERRKWKRWKEER